MTVFLRTVVCSITALLFLLPLQSRAENNIYINSASEISSGISGFDVELNDFNLFGYSVASIGDLNDDGVSDIVVASAADNDGEPQTGAVWILFLNSDNSVKSYQKISKTEGNFYGAIESNDTFGTSVAGLGDLDGDGVEDIAVGAYGDDDGIFPSGALPASLRGAIWILFLNTDGTVKTFQKISETSGISGLKLKDIDLFGISVANIGDVDNDGTIDIAVGARGDDSNGYSTGALYVLFLNKNGTVRTFKKITHGMNGFDDTINSHDNFGSSVTGLSDLDDDGVEDVAVGGYGYDGDGSMAGAVWILFMNVDGTVKNTKRISNSVGIVNNDLGAFDGFGISTALISDVSGDGIAELVVGSFADPNASTTLVGNWLGYGAFRIFTLNRDGTVSNMHSFFASEIIDDYNLLGSYFSYGLTAINDNDNVKIIVGAPYARRLDTLMPGTVWVMQLSSLIGNSNTTPTLTPIGAQTVKEGNTLSLNVSATDPDNDILTYSATGLPSGATFDAQTQIFTWTPGYSDAGTYNVTFTVTDDGEPIASTSETVTITVENTNRTPILTQIGNQTVDEGNTLAFIVSATDHDGDALTYTASNLPIGATFTGNTFVWNTGYNDAGNYSDIEFAVMDNGSPMELAVELITITVGNVNRAPEFTNPGPQEILEDNLLSFSVSASDPDADSVTITASNLPTGATFNGSTFSWTPTRSQEGVYTVTFTATDNGTPAETSTLDVVITVGDNPTPVEQAEDLVDTVVTLDLPQNVENSYLANLQKVAEFIADGKVQPALNQLQAFINKVNQDYARGILTTAERDELIGMAEHLIGEL